MTTWRWEAPDGEYVELSDEIKPTTEAKLFLLERWYDRKVHKYITAHDIAEFEIVTGRPFSA